MHLFYPRRKIFLSVPPGGVTIQSGIKFLKSLSAFQAGRSSVHSDFLAFQKLYAESLKPIHQSTWNPNMPLRDLLYIARLLEKHVNAGNRSIYSSSLIRIPAPRFVVFYNGQRRAEEHTVMKLSDAFEKPETDPALELRVRLVNINPGASPELMERCRTLREYSEFVARIRKHIDEEASIREAVEQAVSECIREGILAEFLRSQRSEVVAMSIFEYDHEVEMKKLTDELRETIRAEEHARAWAEGRAEGREEGRTEGRKEGRAEGRKEGRAEGRKEGRTEGRKEGIQKGMEQGKAQFLLLVLGLRGSVPEWLRERILTETDPGLLEDWMKAAADAVSVEDFLNTVRLAEPT